MGGIVMLQWRQEQQQNEVPAYRWTMNVRSDTVKTFLWPPFGKNLQMSKPSECGTNEC